MSSVPWSRARWSGNEPTRFKAPASVEADDPLVLDLSSSSSSMPVASPCESGSDVMHLDPPTEAPASTAAAQEPPHTDAPEEPELEELDAGFEALLEQSAH
jgi:hypothetical protein